MTETETAPAETVEISEEEAAAARAEILANLPDLARLVRDTYEGQAAEYNTRAARLESVTGDASKAIHDIRESSDDPAVVKFRKYFEDMNAKIEAAVKTINEHISKNLLPESMSEADVEAEKEALKTLKKEAESGRDFFLAQQSVKSLAENGTDPLTLLTGLKGARRGVSKGTGTGTKKPRVKAIYVDGVLMSHDVTKDGKTEVKSTFTDAVKFLSDTHKVKVETSALHEGYFAADGENATEVEYVVNITDKDGASHAHTILVTNNE
jgi:hypothetical protein